MTVSVDDLRALVTDLIEAHRDSDVVTFLGAQFDVGLAAVHWPVGHGGLGVSPHLQDVVDSELEAAARKYDRWRNPIGVGMVAPTVARHGTEEQRSAYLRPAFTGEEIWCQLFSEPGAGSDVATLATRAERDGDGWVVNGQKVWTSLAHDAVHGLLLARTDPKVRKHHGLTAFLIDMHGPGIEVRPLRNLTGDPEFSEVYFTDARIPGSALLGEVGAGWKVAVTTLMNERVSLGSEVTVRESGPIAHALKVWRSLPPDRRDGASRDQLMRHWVDAEVLRLGSLRALALRDQPTPGPEGSVLKLGAALLRQRILSHTVNLLGPAGMVTTHGYDGGRLEGDLLDDFLMAQSDTIAGGTSEIMRNILAERVLGLPGDVRSDKDVPWNEIPRSV